MPYLPAWLRAVPGQPPAAGPSGLLNLAVPLGTVSGDSPGPGQLSWLGVVTAGQARQLAVLAARHAATRWRVVVADAAGRAIAVAPRPSIAQPRGADHFR